MPIVSNIDSGRYSRGLLDHFFGKKNYRVESIALPLLRDVRNRRNAIARVNDPDLGLAYMSEEKLTLVDFREHPGWLKFADHIGLHIQNSPKIAKRLTTLTRTVFYHLVLDSPSDLRAKMFEPDAFARYHAGDTVRMFGKFDHELTPDQIAMFLDGGNVISEEFLDQMMAFSRLQGLIGHNDVFGLGRINTKALAAGGGQVRIIFDEGQIKGDTLISTRERMGGYDVLYTPDNLKTEVSADFVYALFEPQGGKPFSSTEAQIFTDDQTMSWLGNALYPQEELAENLEEYLSRIYSDMETGNVPSFFTYTPKLQDSTSNIDKFQYQALRFERDGFGIQSSYFLLDRIVQGAVNRINKQGKPRWPVYNAVRAHVATDSWLRMAGFDEDYWPKECQNRITPRGYIWYDENTHRMIYNDLDFVEDYDKHGGWDLDDSAVFYARSLDGIRSWIPVRSPNSYGEYSIKRWMEGTFHPVHEKQDGTKVEFPDLDTNLLPEFIWEMDVTYEHEDLVNKAKPANNKYTPENVVDAIQTAVDFDGLFGRWVNAQIVYSAATGSYRKEQLASTESVVDASTQGQSDFAREAIEGDIEVTFEELVDLQAPIDPKLWESRGNPTDKNMSRQMNLQPGRWTAERRHRKIYIATTTKRLRKLSAEVTDRIPQELLQLGERKYHQVRQLYADTRQVLLGQGSKKLTRKPGEKMYVFYGRLNDTLYASIREKAKGAADIEHEMYDIVLGLARRCYTGANSDTMLFQMSAQPGAKHVFDLYVDALQAYGLDDLSQDFERAYRCQVCGDYETVTDRLTYQKRVQDRTCVNCA